MSATPPNAQDAEAARLETALDRIARAASRRSVVASSPGTPETASVAARLDRLIADLRGLLGTQ